MPKFVSFDADDPDGLSRGMAVMDMHSPIVTAGFRYWDGKRRGRQMPARADLDPLIDIPGLVPNVMLFDVRCTPLNFRWRLLGTKVRQNFSKNYTGRWFSEDANYSDQQSSVWQSMELVQQSGRPVLHRPRYVGPHDDFMYVENVLLPLSVDREGWAMQIIFIDFINKKTQ